MADNNQMATATDNANQKTLTTLASAAGLVQKYAAKLLGDDRAAQFATHISIMAQKEPKFKSAKPESVVTAMMACVHLDLMPNTPEQFAHLIPYEMPRGSGKYEIQFQIGYKGLVELAYRSGQVSKIDAELVFPEDIFEVDLGTDRKLTHKYTLESLERDRTKAGEAICAYATAIMKTGEKAFYVLTKSEIKKVKDTVKSNKPDTPWQTWEEEQIKKTVVKKFTKLLPKSGEDNRLAAAAQYDSLAEMGKMRLSDGHIIEGEAVDTSEDRKSKIRAAEAKHAELNNQEFTPKPVPSTD